MSNQPETASLRFSKKKAKEDVYELTDASEFASVTDGLIYDKNNHAKYYTTNHIEIESEVPVDWPCQLFYYNGDDLHYEEGTNRLKRVAFVAAVVLVYVLFSSFDSVIFTRISKTLGPITILFSESVYPVLFVVVIWIAVAIRKIYQLICRPKVQEPQNTSNQSKPKTRCCDFMNMKYMTVMFVIAVCDTLGSLLMIPAIIFMDPILVRIMSQIYIPINMGMARIYARKKYSIPHYIGAAIILNSVLTMFLSTAMKSDKSIQIQAKDVIWFALIIASMLPTSFSQNYKEWHLKEKNLDIWCLNAWVGLIQLTINIPLTLVVLAPMPSNTLDLMVNKTLESSLSLSTPVVWTNLPAYFKFGWQCVFGDFVGYYPANVYDNITDFDDDNITLSTIFIDNGIQCQGIGWLTLIFIIINVFFNIFATDLLKLTTANISAFVSVLTLVITNLIFAIPIVAGIAYRPPQLWDFIALFGCCVGLISFWSVPETIETEVLKSRFHPDETIPKKRGKSCGTILYDFGIALNWFCFHRTDCSCCEEKHIGGYNDVNMEVMT